MPGRTGISCRSPRTSPITINDAVEEMQKDWAIPDKNIRVGQVEQHLRLVDHMSLDMAGQTITLVLNGSA